MTTAIDWDKPGKYPVVLSDALLGKSTNNTYTGIRYNHKPDPSIGASANSAQLKPSSNPHSANYDLSLSDNNDDYTYTGARTSGDGQFILTFDPVRKVLVLDRIDSTFDMNLTSAPWTDDAAQLQSQYEQLEPPMKAIIEEPQPKVPQKKAPKSKAPAATKAKPAPRAKAEKAQKPKPPPREPTPEPEEDSDDGFTVEFPDGQSSHQQYEYRAPIFQREPSEEISDEDEDADADHDGIYEQNQDVDHLKLPSPVNSPGVVGQEEMDLDLEADLEAEMEKALMEQESDESEEE
ncbi:putative ell-associated factor protein [Botrytis fragariae]|uniref:Putative ell-associated factor protein n=1 Tax=Botrytis fragariae TaxID=1964551 RepID=A0A8H6ELU5_9HELO|nr:putative ell-associated factor protein [Botrytis fragariae]KAF5876963.1 putative ell-associated factor protein [Botrytis fragariae]